MTIRNPACRTRVAPPALPTGSRQVRIAVHSAAAPARPALVRYLPRRLSCFHLSPQPDIVKEAFRRTLAGAMELQDRISLPDGIAVADVVYVADCLYHDVPEAVFVRDSSLVTSGQKREIRLNFDRGKAEAERILSSMQAVSRAIVERARTMPGSVARIKVMHDWLVERCRYANDGPQDLWRASGPLLQGKGSCVGLAKAFKYLADRTGVPGMVVTGFFEPKPGHVPISPFSGNHAWNLVFADSAWYHLDVTHDLGMTKEESGTGFQREAPVRYDYFLLSDADMRADRAFCSEGLPPCPRGYRYYERAGLFASTERELERLLRRELRAGSAAVFQLPSQPGGNGLRERVSDLVSNALQSVRPGWKTFRLASNDARGVYRVEADAG